MARKFDLDKQYERYKTLTNRLIKNIEAKGGHPYIDAPISKTNFKLRYETLKEMNEEAVKAGTAVKEKNYARKIANMTVYRFSGKQAASIKESFGDELDKASLQQIKTGNLGSSNLSKFYSDVKLGLEDEDSTLTKMQINAKARAIVSREIFGSD